MSGLARDSILNTIFSGRAVLLAGQGLSATSTEQLLSSCDLSNSRDLQNCLADPVQGEQLAARIHKLDDREPNPELRRICSAPWALVVSMAFDTSIPRALNEANREARRLRHHFVDEAFSATLPKRPHFLDIVYLCRVNDPHHALGQIPHGRRWRQIQQLSQPALLKTLAAQIGPAHLICVAGIGTDDAVNWQLIASSLADIDAERVIWFLTPDDRITRDELIAELPGITVVHGALDEVFRNAENSPAEKERLAELKATILDSDDLVVSVRVDDAMRPIVFRGPELRDLRRHVEVLPDMLDRQTIDEPGARQSAFVSFLSNPRVRPEYENISEGFCFARDAYYESLELIHRRLGQILGDTQKERGRRARQGSGPILLIGGAGSGRTVGLHWIGWRLRLEGIFVLHVSRAGDDVDHGAVEQIIRLAEGRGVPACVLLVDRIDRAAVIDLEHRLLFAGRRAVVVATAVPARKRRYRREEAVVDTQPARTATQETSLPFGLTPSEISRFEAYLLNNCAANPKEIIEHYGAHSSVFSLLYRLVPEARPGMQQMLVAEFHTFLQQIETFQPSVPMPVRGSSLSEQLSAYIAAGKLSAANTPEKTEAANPIAQGWARIAREIPRATLVWSSLDEALTLDLLTRRFPELLALYRPLIDAMEKSGFFTEAKIDREETLGIVARNPGIARILFSAVLTDSLDRLRQIKEFTHCIVWRDTLDPMGIPEQVQMIRVIQRVSPPNGVYHHEYDRIDDLRFISQILADVRKTNNIELPSLMLTEGIVLREIARRLDDSTEQPKLLRDSKSILERARDILRSRSPSRARTHQLGSVLTALAATVGSIMYRELQASAIPGPECLALAREARATAQESQSYQETYQPIDVAFWTNRNLYRALKTASKTDRSQDYGPAIRDALDGMADALDRASELGHMDKVQEDWFTGRLVEFEAIVGDTNIARSMADAEAQRGHFSGACWIARQMAIDPLSNAVTDRAKAGESLTYLERFVPNILASERATTLMQRLWLGSHLEDFQLDDGRLSLACTDSEWHRFEKILVARRHLLEPTRSPYVNFWLAVTAAHLGAFRQMQAYFDEISAAEIGFTRRRLAPLAYLCNASGDPVECEGIVRRREGVDLSLYVTKIGQEIRLPRRFEGLPQLTDVTRGDVISVYLAFNYWGPMAIRPNWEIEQRKDSKRQRPESRRHRKHTKARQSG